MSAPAAAPTLCIAEIMAAVAQITGVSAEAIVGPSRQSKIVKARWLVALIAREKHGTTVTLLGRELDRDHSTISHAIQQARGRLVTDKGFRQAYQKCRELLVERRTQPRPTGCTTEEGEEQVSGIVESTAGRGANTSARQPAKREKPMDKNERARIRRPEQQLMPGKVKCLMCGDEFKSQHKRRLRICKRCKDTEVWRSGELVCHTRFTAGRRAG